jgi:hypothetical protein
MPRAGLLAFSTCGLAGRVCHIWNISMSIPGWLNAPTSPTLFIDTTGKQTDALKHQVGHTMQIQLMRTFFDLGRAPV